jgi:two-component system phosphate regulon sensor histidine kinase PhoR
MERKHDRIILALIAFWVIFTVTLAGWWLIFGLHQLDRLNEFHLEQAAQFRHHYQMLIWEGGVLIVSLIGGGAALFYYARREQKRHAQVEEFFAAFTHDAKTALASLRLQAESLREDLQTTTPNHLLDRLLSDTVRLQLQLENSLFLVNLPGGKLIAEPVTLSQMIEVVRPHWPELAIKQSGDGLVLADVRALESILANLVQNAVTHGQATQVEIDVSKAAPDRLLMKITDNGRGFDGDFDQLGKLFVRPSRHSGSCVGLYLARQLLKRMNSAIAFRRGEREGFVAELTFPSMPTIQTTPQTVRSEL